VRLLKATAIVTHSVRIGPGADLDRLWQSCSIDKVLSALLADRRFEFSVERAIFPHVLHRLFAPGSDRAAEKWKDDLCIDGASDLDLHHLYRAWPWLGEELPKDQQDGATPFAPAPTRTFIEEALFRAAAPRPFLPIGHRILRTPPRSTSRAKAARPSASAGTRRIIVPT